MSLYHYEVTWMIPDRPARTIDGISIRELAEMFREEVIRCIAPNALDAVTQTQYQAETVFMASYGPSVERRPYVKTCWCKAEAHTEADCYEALGDILATLDELEEADGGEPRRNVKTGDRIRALAKKECESCGRELPPGFCSVCDNDE